MTPPRPRTYAQYCGVALALDQVGERWALLVVRDLLLGPQRFSDLLAGLPGLSTNILTDRLRQLEAAGLVSRRRLPPPAASLVYELTPAGRALEPVIVALAGWGLRVRPPLQAGDTLRPSWATFLLKAAFHADRRPATPQHYLLRLGRPEAVFAVHVDASGLRIEVGELAAPTLVIATDPTTLARLLAGAVTTEAMIAAGRLRLQGSTAALADFLTLFQLPERFVLPSDPAPS